MGNSGSWALVAALAGFLFGFDTAVISGAEQAVQAEWSMSDLLHGLAISAALWGTVIGALTAGWPLDRFGRKKTLVWIGILYALSAIGSALAWDPTSFMIFRFIGGLGVGDSLAGLRHNRVIGGNDDDGNVGSVGAALPNAGEGFVPRGI